MLSVTLELTEPEEKTMEAMLNADKTRGIPFDRDTFEEVRQIGKKEGRAFKNQALVLIREALQARKEAEENNG